MTESRRQPARKPTRRPAASRRPTPPLGAVPASAGRPAGAGELSRVPAPISSAAAAGRAVTAAARTAWIRRSATTARRGPIGYGGPPPGYPAGPYDPYQAYPAGPGQGYPQTNGLAIASLITSIVSLPFR